MSMAMRTEAGELPRSVAHRALERLARRRRHLHHNGVHGPRAQHRCGDPAAPARPRPAPRMMAVAHWPLFVGLAVVIVYALFVGGLALAGRREDARALAGFIPDCIVLFRRVLADPRTP